MIFNLMVKDIRGYGRYILLGIFLPSIFYISFFSIQHFKWESSVAICSFTIFAAISYFSFSENKQKLNVFICSLPVTRKSIVVARYLLSLCIVIFGIALYLFLFYILDPLYTEPKTKFYEIINLKALITGLMMISVSTSLFLPAIYRFRTIGMAFTIALVIAFLIYSLITFVYSNDPLVDLHFEKGNVLKSLILISLIILLPVISMVVSKKLFRGRDL